jgi:hypothetical protein
MKFKFEKGTTVSRPAIRMTLRYGKMQRKIVLPDPPYPQLGDTVSIEGKNWTVIQLEHTEVLVKYLYEGGHLRQVVP